MSLFLLQQNSPNFNLPKEDKPMVKPFEISGNGNNEHGALQNTFQLELQYYNVI
jgi:hypothetical protein